MIEMVVVLLLMGIIAATVLGRAITTSDLDLNSEPDKIRNHLRYAQAEAMKRSNAIWGIQSQSNEYWLFRVTKTGSEEVQLPGVNYPAGSTRINLSDSGVTLDNFKLVFNKIGKPFKNNTNEVPNTPVTAADPAIKVTAPSGKSQSITITPETGLIQ